MPYIGQTGQSWPKGICRGAWMTAGAVPLECWRSVLEQAGRPGEMGSPPCVAAPIGFSHAGTQNAHGLVPAGAKHGA